VPPGSPVKLPRYDSRFVTVSAAISALFSRRRDDLALRLSIDGLLLLAVAGVLTIFFDKEKKGKLDVMGALVALEGVVEPTQVFPRQIPPQCQHVMLFIGFPSRASITRRVGRSIDPMYCSRSRVPLVASLGTFPLSGTFPRQQ
jgi:hypothetical protein